MADLTHKLPMSRLMNDMTATIVVTGVRRWTWRMYLCIWLIRLAAVVAPMSVGVEIDSNLPDLPDEQ
jgi:hypothetical protein